MIPWRLFRLGIIFLFFASCKIGKKPILKNGDYIQSLINSGNRFVKIPRGIYVIDKPIVIPSNIHINGNNAEFQLGNHMVHAFSIKNGNNITISNLIITGLREGYDLERYTHKMEKNLIKINNSRNLNLSNLYLKNHTFSLLSINDSKDIKITECRFEEVGLPKPKSLKPFLYSYDGIYFNASKDDQCKNINIEKCQFFNIGMGDGFSSEVRQDGDGIHFQSKNLLGISGLKISDCNFENCSARGIKAQSGKRIIIEKSKFRFCTSGIGFVLETPIQFVKINDNKISDCNIAIANGHPFDVTDVTISNNEISDVNYAIRTSGMAIFKKINIVENQIQNIQRCVFDGDMQIGRIYKNIIIDYAMAMDNSYYMAILLAGRTKDVEINSNEFRTSFDTKTAVYVYPSAKDIVIKKNKIHLPETQFKNQYIIYSTDKKISNQINNNNLKLVKKKS